MKSYDLLKDMICRELDRIANKGELNSQNLEMVDKLTHSLKSIETIQAMDDYDGYSGARGRGAYARRDSRGRYSNDGYHADYSGRYSRDMMESLRDLEMSAPDEHTRRMVQEWKKQAERD
jgi:hypothetical protein